MAISVGGTTFTIFADNSPFKKGMNEAKDIRQKVSDVISSFDKKEALSAAKVNEAYNKRIAKQEELNNAIKNGESEKVIVRIRTELARLTSAEEKAVAQSIALNKQRRESYKKVANEMKEVNKVSKATSGFLGGLTSEIIKFSVGFASVSAFKNLIDSLDSIGKRARDIGMTASQLQEFSHQCKLSGMSSSQLDSSIKAFNRNISLATMGTGEAKSALESMNIQLTDANGRTKSQSELLKETAYYFADNAGNADNAGKAARIFGESGVELLRIFGQGREVINDVFNAKGIDDASAAAERFNDSLENIQNAAFKFGADIVDGWSQIIDFVSDVTGDGIGSTEAKRNWKKYQEQLKKEEIARIESEEARAKKVEEINARVREADAKLFESRMSDMDKVINYRNDISNLTKELEEVREKEGMSDRYIELYNKRVEKTIALERVEKQIAKETDARAKKIADEEKRKKEKELNAKAEAEKKAKAEAEAIAKKEKAIKDSYNEFLKEHELQKQIAIAKYNGNTALVERIKQEAEAQKLAEKYNISLKEANKLLNEQKKIKEISEGKNTKYSDAEIAKAKKILEKGKSGSIGKKTLEDAQNIVDGKETKHNLSIFGSANDKRIKGKKYNFNEERNLNRRYSDNDHPPSAKEPKNDTKKEEENNKRISSMDETLKGIQVLLADIKTLQQQAVVETSNLSKAITE